MTRESTGQYQVATTLGASVRAFVPAPLPPGRRRGRVFAYDRYIAILNEGAQPL